MRYDALGHRALGQIPLFAQRNRSHSKQKLSHETYRAEYISLPLSSSNEILSFDRVRSKAAGPPGDRIGCRFTGPVSKIETEDRKTVPEATTLRHHLPSPPLAVPTPCSATGRPSPRPNVWVGREFLGSPSAWATFARPADAGRSRRRAVGVRGGGGVFARDGIGPLNMQAGADARIIYLDVDGVVTTVGYQRQAGRDRLNPVQVARVAALVREFDARVVVSSTWRVDDCRPTLIEAGLPETCFHPDWRTAILPTSRDAETGAMRPAEQAGRGDEISEHATRNRITRYLILDDVEVGPAHAGRHVRPMAECGLSDADAILARRLLAGMADAPPRMGRAGTVPSSVDLRSRRD